MAKHTVTTSEGWGGFQHVALDDMQLAILHSAMFQDYLKVVAEAGLKAAQETVPVRTGALRDSIESEITAEGEVIIRADTPYATSVERGDGGRTPVPFLSGAALDAMKKVRKPK